MTEPRTAAGRAHAQADIESWQRLAALATNTTDEMREKVPIAINESILAIEAEAAVIDVERLAAAIGKAHWLGDPISFGGRTIRDAAKHIAAAYSEAGDE